MSERAAQDPVAQAQWYFEGPGRLKDGQEWRAVATYRCKRSHLLTHVLKTPGGYVLYNLRRGTNSGLGEPDEVVGLLPELNGHSGDFDVPLGACKCQSVRTRLLADIWGDVDRRKTGDITI